MAFITRHLKELQEVSFTPDYVDLDNVGPLY